MKSAYFAASAAVLLLGSAATAQTVSDTSLQNINGPYGANTATTTTTSTGTRTTVTGPGANRVSGTATPGTWYQANVGSGGTVGITTDYARDGNGSAYFSTNGTTGKADLINYFSNGNGGIGQSLLSNLTSASFDFYRDGASTTNANYAPVLRLDVLKNGSFAGSLVFENVYQAQQPAPFDAWSTLTSSLTSGIWWATNAALGPTSAAATGGQKSLAQWIAGNAGSTLTVYGVELGVGSGWDNTFFGGADNVRVNFADGRSITSNFEVAQVTAAVPEPATWAMMLIGFGAIGFASRRGRKVTPRVSYAD